MSDDEAVKALREWCGAPGELTIGLVVRHRNGASDPEVARTAQRLLATAPALLARLEAAEGLLREARDWMASMSMQQGRPSKALLKDIDAIDAFLAGKEANRG